ncbi:hypothetical protein [Streptomyces indicus]|uniref:Uncharacterized protein n=1 Tax=Streptomyces indicus TaxID=417292 RepID=A0A1G9AK95_9ACTN|nr:hypothetical protein [Streptomyces indicus]SDK27708.1 hypothetical protein SAMN05421806_10610 [Streptomyces indicus]
MPRTADDLLAALEPLAHPQRLRHLSLAARSLAAEGGLPEVLAELDGRGPYERRLAALAALVGRQAGFLEARLADPDRVIRGYALRAARTLLSDEAIEAAYTDASAEQRRRLAQVVIGSGRTAPAERLVPRLREEWGDEEAARLLPGCSAAFVAVRLPELAHAVTSWTGLARRHPDLVIDHAARELAAQKQQVRRAQWWELHASGIAAAAPLRPERVLTLLEEYGPAALPPRLRDQLGALIAADAERTVRWLLAPERETQRYEPLWSPGLLRKLVRADPPSLTELGRRWLLRPDHLAALLKAMPPGRRGAFLDACRATVSLGEQPTPEAVLDLLPRERQRAEARHWVPKGRAEDWFWGDVLETLSYGPLDEAEPELLAALRRPDAQDRALVWPLLIACVGRSGDRAAMTGLLERMRGLRNEQDPVRAKALGALAGLHPRLFAAEDVAALDRILLDALEARDSSAETRTALRRLAVRLLVEHATAGGEEGAGEDGRPALLVWGMRALERLAGYAGLFSFGRLDRTLRRGQEHALFATLRPWLEAAADKAEFGLLFALAAALGDRARAMPALQSMLEQAVTYGSDRDVATAAPLWLADPATRDERAAAILAREPSAAVLGSVQAVLTRRRTDLLDVLLGEQPPYGRFLTAGKRRPLPGFHDAGRWLPRQQEAAVRLAAEVVADTTRPASERVAALRGAAQVPLYGRQLALAQIDSAETVIAEAALGALPWTDRPEESLPLLLAHAGGDRARVAVYAAGGVARCTAPSELSVQLGEVLSPARGAKVTSRKEAVRLAARFLPVRQAVALLADVFHAPDQHPDVQAAVVSVLPRLLGAPEAWDLLGAAAQGPPQAQRAVIGLSPWALPAAHRPRYARLVGGLCRSAEREVATRALNSLPQWADDAPDVVTHLGRAVADLEERTNWRTAAWALGSLAVSALPHPAGGVAEGSLLHSTVAELLEAVRSGAYEAQADRDLPARRRLISLVEGLPAEPVALVRPVLESLAGQLAGEPSLGDLRAGILRRLVDLRADLPELMARLTALADAVDGRPVLAAEQARHLNHPSPYGTPLAPQESALAAARYLAEDGRTTTGLLAAGLVATLGQRLSWPEEWRALLRQLRRHGDADVRHLAYGTTTGQE